jgi:hypothetical protein
MDRGGNPGRIYPPNTGGFAEPASVRGSKRSRTPPRAVEGELAPVKRSRGRPRRQLVLKTSPRNIASLSVAGDQDVSRLSSPLTKSLPMNDNISYSQTPPRQQEFPPDSLKSPQPDLGGYRSHIVPTIQVDEFPKEEDCSRPKYISRFQTANLPNVLASKTNLPGSRPPMGRPLTPSGYLATQGAPPFYAAVTTRPSLDYVPPAGRAPASTGYLSPMVPTPLSTPMQTLPALQHQIDFNTFGSINLSTSPDGEPKQDTGRETGKRKQKFPVSILGSNKKFHEFNAVIDEDSDESFTNPSVLNKLGWRSLPLPWRVVKSQLTTIGLVTAQKWIRMTLGSPKAGIRKVIYEMNVLEDDSILEYDVIIGLDILKYPGNPLHVANLFPISSGFGVTSGSSWFLSSCRLYIKQQATETCCYIVEATANRLGGSLVPRGSVAIDTMASREDYPTTEFFPESATLPSPLHPTMSPWHDWTIGNTQLSTAATSYTTEEAMAASTSLASDEGLSYTQLLNCQSNGSEGLDYQAWDVAL